MPSNPGPEQVPQLWVVVCSDLHTAYGPFAQVENATAMARELTDDPRSDCVYVPVAMRIQGQATIERIAPPQDIIQKKMGGGYL